MRKRITKKFLRKTNIGANGYRWFLKQKTCDLQIIIKRLEKNECFGSLDWLLCQLLTKNQKSNFLAHWNTISFNLHYSFNYVWDYRDIKSHYFFQMQDKRLKKELFEYGINLLNNKQ